MQRFIAGLFLAICGCLHAQTIDLLASIPFSFHAGNAILPAGEYRVHHENHTLVIQERTGAHTALLLANDAYQPNLPSRSTLTFNRYGENYFLSSLSVVGDAYGSALPKTRSEKELARGGDLGQSVSVALK
ncbi:MAG: hypothetical protein JO336_09305 [Acidobacteriia bacterium]|nr:hypothetical protein [Terriglobia bacterium]MBV8902098.1 hypothetical protein [Terriglobia bacterium]MBV9743271.1 hypothetical protein [Terriglobia bacterium]